MPSATHVGDKGALERRLDYAVSRLHEQSEDTWNAFSKMLRPNSVLGYNMPKTPASCIPSKGVNYQICDNVKRFPRLPNASLISALPSKLFVLLCVKEAFSLHIYWSHCRTNCPVLLPLELLRSLEITRHWPRTRWWRRNRRLVGTPTFPLLTCPRTPRRDVCSCAGTCCLKVCLGVREIRCLGFPYSILAAFWFDYSLAYTFSHHQQACPPSLLVVLPLLAVSSALHA